MRVRDKGFALLELVMVFALTALVLTLALASWQQLQARQQVQQIILQLQIEIQHAQMRAQNNHQPIHWWPKFLLPKRCSMRYKGFPEQYHDLQWLADGNFAQQNGTFTVCCGRQCGKLVIAKTGRTRYQLNT